MWCSSVVLSHQSALHSGYVGLAVVRYHLGVTLWIICCVYINIPIQLKLSGKRLVSYVCIHPVYTYVDHLDESKTIVSLTIKGMILVHNSAQRQALLTIRAVSLRHGTTVNIYTCTSPGMWKLSLFTFTCSVTYRHQSHL